MGIIPGVQHHHRSPAPDTPPGLVSPTSSSYSTTRSEASSWRRAGPPSPPMSSYGRQSPADMVKSERGPEETRGPALRDSTAGQTSAPRQQLPSLSSLFGPPPPARPLHSPHSDHTATFSAHSPLDGRPPSSVPALERSFSSSSYFPSSTSAGTSIAQPRSSYDPRYDGQHNHPRTPYPGPHSPHVREPEHHRAGSGSDYSTGSKWSLPHEASSARGEYTLGSTREPQGQPPPFKPMPHDTYSRQLPSLSHSHSSHDLADREGAIYLRPPIVPGTLPPTPSSAVSSSEGGVSGALAPGGAGGPPGSTAVKDGLGPKIWTGSHFLPRFVRAAEVAGEGLCYFYDDGSYCKTVIDGEQVNAHWGVTKAGKPRKRLAIACVTCREKKIKCDPDYPRCVQCEKFGRVCRFKNAPRGGHNSPSTPPAELEQPRRLGVLIRPPPESPRPGSNSSASVSPRTTVRPASPEPLMASSKRMRTGYDHYYPPRESYGSSSAPMASAGSRDRHSPTTAAHHHSYSPTHARAPPLETAPRATTILSMPVPKQMALPTSTLPWQQPDLRLPRIHEDVLMRAWQKDPYVSDPQSVSTALSSFLTALDASALRFLPRGHFMAWAGSGAATPPSQIPPPPQAPPPQTQTQNAELNRASSAHTKSPEDLMFVYSALALGSAVPSSSGGEESGAGKIADEYAQVARFAAERVAPCLQLVQTRLVLAIYYATVNQRKEAGEMINSAISTAWGLGMNLELVEEEKQEEQGITGPYGLSGNGFAECRRRTFWACFIWERIHGLATTPYQPAMIDQEDIFLRLPYEDSSFERAESPNITPIVDLSNAPEFAQGSTASEDDMAGCRLVLVAAIWGNIMATTYRAAHRRLPTGSANDDSTSFHDRMTGRLQACLAPLSSTTTGDKSSRIFCHLGLLVLNRYNLQASLNREECVRTAQSHASELIHLVTPGATFTPAYTSLIIADYVILEAVDVLTATGVVGELPHLLGRLFGLPKMRMHTDIVIKRVTALQQVFNACDRKDGMKSGEPVDGVQVFQQEVENNAEHGTESLGKGTTEQRLVWQWKEPLGRRRFSKEIDVIYGSLHEAAGPSGR